MKVTVLGAGNGGCATAADLASRGFEVAISDLPGFGGTLTPIAERGGLHLSGVLGEHDVAVHATPDLHRALAGASVVLVAVPAFGHAAFARLVAPLLSDDQVVVLTPGATGGALEWAHVASAARGSPDQPVAETLSLPYACRKVSPVHVDVSGVKTLLPLAAFPGRLTATLVEALGTVFPRGVRAAASVLETSLNNLNAMAHPVPMLLNVGWIEATGGAFAFYFDGVTPSVSMAMEAVDGERLAILEALGLEPVSMNEWDRRLYGLVGATAHEINQASAVHRGIRAPASLEARYLTEDIPFGLAPIASIGRELGVPTPTTSLFLDLATLLLGDRVLEGARSAASLGLAGLTAAGMTAFAESGRHLNREVRARPRAGLGA